jgi:hypothetical protein
VQGRPATWPGRPPGGSWHPPGARRPQSADRCMAGQPEAWRDTGKLPATAADRPPGGDPGLVKVSVPEARRLLRPATPMSRAARDLGYAGSRRHQARARSHHYHAQHIAAGVTRPLPDEEGRYATNRNFTAPTSTQ